MTVVDTAKVKYALLGLNQMDLDRLVKGDLLDFDGLAVLKGTPLLLCFKATDEALTVALEEAATSLHYKVINIATLPWPPSRQ